MVEFKDTPLDDAIRYLRSMSAQLDTAKQGVNILVAQDVNLEKTISLHLTDALLADALRYVTELSQTTYRVDPEAVFISPAE